MTIILTAGVSIAGAAQPIGASLTLETALEASLVSQGKAQYSTPPELPGDKGEPVMARRNLTGGIKEMTVAGETLASFATVPGDEVAGVTVEV